MHFKYLRFITKFGTDAAIKPRNNLLHSNKLSTKCALFHIVLEIHQKYLGKHHKSTKPL